MKAYFGFHVASGLWWARAGEPCRMTCWGTTKEQAQRKLRRFLERFSQTAVEWLEIVGPGASEAPPD
jgi:hypothetical protein